MERLLKLFEVVRANVNDFFTNRLHKISAGTLEWVAIATMHAGTIPSFLALMSGVSNRAPSVDLVLMLWAALTLLFFRSVLMKDMFNIVTNGVGFILQAVMLVLIFFK
jgi:hypothetical protein